MDSTILTHADTKLIVEAIGVFIFSNLASEAIKYVGLKAFKKVDGLFHTFLD